MFVVTIIVTLVYAVMVSGSAWAKASRQEAVVASLTAVGFPNDRIPLLAAPLGAGALGLVIGLFWAPLGIAAAIGLVIYFVLAVAAHLRAHDTKGVPAPGMFLVLAVVVLVLRSVTA